MSHRNWATLRVTTLAVAALGIAAGRPWQLFAQAPEPAKGVKFAQVSPVELKEWLSYLASDELQGRQIFTEGYGTAAQYIADHLKSWNVKPIGDDGTYLQMVKLKGYRVTRNSSVTVEVNGQSRTFKHGDHVTFAVNSGGKQTLSFSGVEFIGSAADADLEKLSLKDKLVVAMSLAAGPGRGAGRAGMSAAVTRMGARAGVLFAAMPAAPTPAEEALTRAQVALAQANEAVTQAQQAVMAAQRGGGGAGFARGAAPAGRAGAPPAPPNLTTVARVDGLVAPQFTADETFFEFLFSAGPVKLANLRAKADKGEALPTLTVPAKVTIAIDNTFETVATQVSKNVVGLIEGSNPKLKDTYVMYGAHLDHVGYRTAPLVGRGGGGGGCRRTIDSVAAQLAAGRAGQAAGGGGRAGAPAPATVPPGSAVPTGSGVPAGSGVPLDPQDVIFNGADDDGSGSTSLLGVAKAFATGPRPKRSVVVIWHTGEESGLFGSRYNADFPVVPLENVQTQINMDMVGRDDCDNANGDYSNSVFVVGADRISTDLHNLLVDTNATLSKPLKLDFELNDPKDPESVYTRSDHYSYAAKGIPIAFVTTGLHNDYHRVSDTVDKITFPKMARITQLVYQLGFAVANTDKTLARDNKGPRAGKGFDGKIEKK